MAIKYNIKLSTIFNIALFVIAFLLPRIIDETYRFTNHNLWAFSRLTTFSFLGVSGLLTLVNILFIVPDLKDRMNIFAFIPNAVIALFWIIFFCAILIK